MADADGFGPEDLATYFPVSRETRDRLSEMITHLDIWRRRINLIGPREFESVWRRHVLDSLQLAPLLPDSGAVLDMGSGGGFPGLVVACLRTPLSGPVHMVDSVGKKCAFLGHVIRELNLNAKAHHCRIEEFELSGVSCVTARAFAPLEVLLEHGETWFSKGAFGLFLKGQNWREELTLAEKYWRFQCQVIPSVSDADGVILKLSEISRVGD